MSVVKIAEERVRRGWAPEGHREAVEALGNGEYLVSCRDCGAGPRWAGTVMTAKVVRLEHEVQGGMGS